MKGAENLKIFLEKVSGIYGRPNRRYTSIVNRAGKKKPVRTHQSWGEVLVVWWFPMLVGIIAMIAVTRC
jgi:hypothetical protein